MDYATGRDMRQKMMRHAYCVDDVCSLVRLVYEDRVDYHDGDWELRPGITLHLVGGQFPAEGLRGGGALGGGPASEAGEGGVGAGGQEALHHAAAVELRLDQLAPGGCQEWPLGLDLAHDSFPFLIRPRIAAPVQLAGDSDTVGWPEHGRAA